MYVCMYVCIYVFTYVCMYAYHRQHINNTAQMVRGKGFVCLYVCMYVCMYLSMVESGLKGQQLVKVTSVAEIKQSNSKHKTVQFNGEKKSCYRIHENIAGNIFPALPFIHTEQKTDMLANSAVSSIYHAMFSYTHEFIHNFDEYFSAKRTCWPTVRRAQRTSEVWTGCLHAGPKWSNVCGPSSQSGFWLQDQRARDEWSSPCDYIL
jgi:hypothetical protein